MTSCPLLHVAMIPFLNLPFRSLLLSTLVCHLPHCITDVSVSRGLRAIRCLQPIVPPLISSANNALDCRCPQHDGVPFLLCASAAPGCPCTLYSPPSSSLSCWSRRISAPPASCYCVPAPLLRSPCFPLPVVRLVRRLERPFLLSRCAAVPSVPPPPWPPRLLCLPPRCSARAPPPFCWPPALRLSHRLHFAAPSAP